MQGDTFFSVSRSATGEPITLLVLTAQSGKVVPFSWEAGGWKSARDLLPYAMGEQTSILASAISAQDAERLASYLGIDLTSLPRA